MIGMGYKFTLDDVARNFTTTNRARTSVERQQIVALRNIGSYLVVVAKRSIRQVGKFGRPSKPKKPPKSRIGSLKRLIRFAYFQKLTGGNVVAGPTSIRSRSKFKPIKKTVPEILERGGLGRISKPIRLRANNINDGQAKQQAIREERERLKEFYGGGRGDDGRFLKGRRKAPRVKSTSFVTLKPGTYPVAERPFMSTALQKTRSATRLRRWFQTLKRLS